MSETAKGFNSPKFIFSDKPNKLSFYVFYSLYMLNDKTLNSKRLEHLLWNYIKMELFYISGDCKHSGNCCSNLMLYQKGTPLDTAKKFKEHLKENPKYTRFTPEKNIGTKILSYSCDCLNPENKCTDYKNRPQICKSYPVSFFIQNDKIYDTCGYKVTPKFTPKIKNTKLKIRIQTLQKLNNIQEKVIY